MNLALFGASGFLGYDFFKCATRIPDLRLQVYSTSPQGLANLKRHDASLTHISVTQISHLDLGEADVVVSFAHPFRIRDGLGPTEQMENFAECLRKNHQRRPRTVVQLSSVAVFEPFQRGRFFAEGEHLVPSGDSYADQKISLENLISAAGVPAILLRPTFVYGPFGVDFTDLFLNGFAAGPVCYHSLKGKMQPIYVRDISELIVRMIEDFEPGIFHAAGPEVLSWQDYLHQHELIVDGGRLIHRPETRKAREKKNYVGLLTTAALATLRLPEVRDLIHPLVRLFPGFIRSKMKSQVDETRTNHSPSVATMPQPTGFNFHEGLRVRLANKLATDYFSQDRLVGLDKTHQRYPGSCGTALGSKLEEIRRYFLFRFSDQQSPLR